MVGGLPLKLGKWKSGGGSIRKMMRDNGGIGMVEGGMRNEINGGGM